MSQAFAPNAASDLLRGSPAAARWQASTRAAGGAGAFHAPVRELRLACMTSRSPSHRYARGRKRRRLRRAFWGFRSQGTSPRHCRRYFRTAHRRPRRLIVHQIGPSFAARRQRPAQPALRTAQYHPAQQVQASPSAGTTTGQCPSSISESVKSYKVLVGLEIHVQLATATKMFTAAPNGATNFGAEPNTLVDEQVLGLPGVLPVMNKKAVEYSIKVGLALGCKIARHTKWDRKSYYYPDLPKNYQISQYDLPLCHEGCSRSPARRRHAADRPDPPGAPGRGRRQAAARGAGRLRDRSQHRGPQPRGHAAAGDRHRAGSSPRRSRSRRSAQELQKLVQFLGVSEGQMQMGHMRFEPNINVHITDQDGNVHKTAITEIKNLNSFCVLERATAYEIRRQIHAVGGDRLARQEEHLRLGRGQPRRPSTSATRRRRTTTATSPTRTWCRSR